MTAISATTLLYSTPLVFKASDLLFSATRIEIPSTADEYTKGGIELLPAKLGLTDELISGAGEAARIATVGGTASTTALPGLIWSSGYMVSAADENEVEELDSEKNWMCYVSLVKNIPTLRCLAAVAAGQEKGLAELKDKNKITNGTTTIFALGK